MAKDEISKISVDDVRSVLILRSNFTFLAMCYAVMDGTTEKFQSLELSEKKHVDSELSEPGRFQKQEPTFVTVELLEHMLNQGLVALDKKGLEPRDFREFEKKTGCDLLRAMDGDESYREADPERQRLYPDLDEVVGGDKVEGSKGGKPRGSETAKEA